MNPSWAAILDALNIASAQHRSSRGFEATAAQVAEALGTDPRLVQIWNFSLSTAQVAQGLGRLSRAEGPRPAMVSRVPGSRAGWRLTDAGSRWLLMYR